MAGIASLLPFLASLKKQTPDFSGMTSDDATEGLANASAPSVIKAMQQPYAGPPTAAGDQPTAPPPPQQQGPAPDMSIGQGRTLPAGIAEKPGTTNPKLSKGTQLLMLLRGGLEGGLQGMAANAQTYAQTGRNAGFGGGFSGGMQIPGFLQQYQRNQLAQQQAQTELLKQQAQEINVPGYGSMPAGLAKVLFPSLIKGQATTQAATIGAGGRTGAAQISADARIKAAQMGLGPVADVPQDLQEQFGLPAQLPLKMLNTAESAANKPLTTVQGEGGPAIVNKQTKQTTNLGLGAPALARPVQVADPNNPGNISYQSAGQAMQQGAMAPSSAPALTAKATARAIAPGGKVGEEINAFNTAMQHADLLLQAAKELNNPNSRTIAGIKNRLSTEFGDPDVTNFDAISHVYQNEIQKMIAGGHITNAELDKNAASVPSNANLQTITKVLGSYKQLAQSKLNNRIQQVQAGMKGQANIQQNPAPNTQNGNFDWSQHPVIK